MKTNKTSGAEVAYNEGLKAAVTIIKKHSQLVINHNQQEWIKKALARYNWYGNNLQHALFSTLTEDGLPELSNEEFVLAMQTISKKIMETEFTKVSQYQKLITEREEIKKRKFVLWKKRRRLN